MDEEYWRKMLNLYGKSYNKNMELLQDFLKLNRGYIFEKPIDEMVIVLCSGGMDSTILIDLVIKNWNSKVIIIYFKRDAKNEKWEERAVDFFYEFYKKRYPKNIVDLLKLRVQIPLRINKEYLDRTRQKILGLPMRNSTMWNNAIAQAVYLSGKYNTTIRTILIGSVKDDRDNPESGPLSLLSQTINTCICTAIWNWQIYSPLLDDSFKKGGFSKLDLIKYAQENDIRIEKTRSCFEKTEIPCRKCLACENRLIAFNEYRKLLE
ncbi:MAG: 7-cyano-7-deazaguanine synthase [Candidatus Helarchaeota archaeon]|nr:7-cyano-7-deazaguanine synthase [Candidatus Helarchaeota archaeon]